MTCKLRRIRRQSRHKGSYPHLSFDVVWLIVFLTMYHASLLWITAGGPPAIQVHLGFLSNPRKRPSTKRRAILNPKAVNFVVVACFIMSGYDRALSVFSPGSPSHLPPSDHIDGHIFQVEYAGEAVKRGSSAVSPKTHLLF